MDTNEKDLDDLSAENKSSADEKNDLSLDKGKGDATNDKKGKHVVRDCIYLALSIILIGLLATCIILFAIGYRPAVVLTPSMRPTIIPGSLVLVKSVDTDTIKEGDVIMFWPTSEGESGKSDEISVTHRVVKVVVLSDGKRQFITKGDNNSSNDTAPIPESQVIGKIGMVIPYVGVVFLFIKNNLFIVIFGLIAIICLWYLVSMIISSKKAKANAENSDNQHSDDMSGDGKE